MQRLGQALVFLLVFVGVGLGCSFLLIPHVAPPVSGPNAPVQPPPSETTPTPTSSREDSPAPPAARIAPPRNATQREADDIEARRAPYYRWLHSQFGDTLAGEQSNSSDQATLDLYTNRSDSSLVLTLLGQAVQPYADQYGFNHVRFFMPNPPGSVEQYRFAAEASPSPDGSWKAFEK